MFIFIFIFICIHPPSSSAINNPLPPFVIHPAHLDRVLDPRDLPLELLALRLELGAARDPALAEAVLELARRRGQGRRGFGSGLVFRSVCVCVCVVVAV